MFSALWNFILVNPILNVLVALYKFTGSMGIAIIVLTLIIRALLVPVMVPGTRNLKKQQELQPELEKIKNKYKHDKAKQAELQMKLFKEHGINPTFGCLSQIAMITVLIALFTVIQLFTVKGNGQLSDINHRIYFSNLTIGANETIQTNFLYMDLAKPDPLFILAILSGVFQFIASKMTIPYIEKAEKLAEKTEPKADDLAFMMQQQSLYLMPVMNVIIGVTLPSGVVLYILVTTIFMIVQNYFVTGWGGLKPYINKLRYLRKAKI